ncbi:MAG: N-acetyltransferase [Candidatus Brockarchaeota archaeon]|nr:N-acetyltransferase [Candidatus Brockarchaeota archaeon]
MSADTEVQVFQDDDSFYIPLPNSQKALLKYRLEEGKIYVLSAYTPPEYRGMGLASKLMDEVVKFALEKNLKIVPICSYAQHYMDKHQELRNLIVEWG